MDDCDFQELSKYKWCAFRTDGKFYAVRSVNRSQLVFMHRQIAGTPKGKKTDHWDGDGLNNTRKNLRVCSHSQNMRNRVVLSKANTSGYKGVAFYKRSETDKKWGARIVVNKKLIHLGMFSDKEEAARAYDAAATIQFGQFARLNFPARVGN